ncbi:glycoside hydrolase family 24 protein, partial [Coprinopsis sp. MPI-PUGE-AT-0042]
PGINQATVGLIQEFEGFEDVPRPDPIGLPTAGFGHLCKQTNCAEVTAAGFTFPLSQQEGVQLLQNDIGQFTSCLNDMLNDNVVLNENQFGALTSFTFNLGCRTVQRSTLMRRLNAGENPNTVAGQEMPKFRLANGKVFNGLVRRRAAEVALFQTPSNTVALPVCN